MSIPTSKQAGVPANPDAQWRWKLLAPQYWPTWLALGFFRLFEPLPYPVLMSIGRGVGWVARHLPIGFVRIARTNLRLCFPALNDEQREQLLHNHFASVGMSLMETAMAWWSSDKRIAELTEVVGLEHLQAVQNQGRGALLLSAHFTPLEIGVRAIVPKGVDINIMYRPASNPVMGFFLARNRAHHAKRAIRRDDIRVLIGALKAAEPVWYAPDQAYRKKGAQLVKFFGIPCATNTATSRLAKMTNAAVMPFFPERLPNDAGYRVTLFPPLENFPSDDAIADAESYHHAIEQHIAKVPEQYLWIHRRFKGLSDDYPNYYRRDTGHETRDKAAH